ncbi:MAG: insulinase family protein [bacterium]|nr:insulinase family protein [bacterium]
MITKYKQDNGLTVLLEPVDEAVSISVGLWLKTGSRNEKIFQYGYAHFVEHMLFKGTKNYSAHDIAKMVDRVGGQHNAATNREYTCYYINVVSDHLELAIKIISDMYYNSLLSSEEIKKEKNVIIEEIRMYEDTPDEFIHDLFIENMFSGHPLSHSILGSIDGIDQTSREQLAGFYESHYRDDNAIFVIAGKMDVNKAQDLISAHFDREPNSTSLIKAPPAAPPERLYYTHVERDLEQVHFCLGTEGINRYDDDRWALYCLSTILGGSMSSRLFQNIREKEGISYSIYSFHSSYTDAGLFGIYCATSPDNYSKALELIVKECREMLEKGIQEDELRDAKTFMKGNLALSYESIEVRMGQLAKNELAFEKYYSFDDIIKKINEVTLDDFGNIAKRLFKNKKLSLISVGKKPDDRNNDSDLIIS